MNMVEWKKLGDICEIKGRIGFRGYTRDDQVDKGKGAISLSPGNIDNGSMNYESCTYITWDKYEESPEIIVNEGDIILCKTASVGKVARIRHLPEKATINPQLVLIKNIQTNPQYLFYVLDDKPFQSKIKGLAGIGSVPNVSQAKLSAIEIPIPSLSEQIRIVGILDTFTASVDNLKEQIAQRRKQYEYYRDQLYYANKSDLLEASKRGETIVKSLDELGTFTRGRRFVRTDIVPEGVPCIHYGDMYTYYGVSAEETPTHLTKELSSKLRFAKYGDVVIVAAGENDLDIGVGVAWLGNEPVVVHDACFIFEHKMNPKYLSHFMRSRNYHQQIRMGVVDGKICSISAKELGRALIAVPSLQEQQRIVSILDTFEASIQNLETQLSQREKQYEYYRNKLLTFE